MFLHDKTGKAEAEVADLKHDVTRLQNSLNKEANARIEAEAEIARLSAANIGPANKIYDLFYNIRYGASSGLWSKEEIVREVNNILLAAKGAP